MAMVECPRCGAMVSDKAKKCVHCGEVLIPEEKKYCMECGAELIEGMSECPNCGCPVEEQLNAQLNEKPQKVEVTGVKVTRKIKIIIGIAIAVLILGGVTIFGVTQYQKKKAAKEYAESVKTYSDNLELATVTVLKGAGDAEDCGNLIKNVWYNAIYKEKDDETDKYTRPDGYFVSDFNDALGNLFVDSSFSSKIDSIDKNQDTVNSLMKKLKNPPEEYKDAYDALSDFYDAYLALTGSMSYDGKMEVVNTAIEECIPEMASAADNNPNAQLLIRALQFSSGASWLTAKPVPVEDYSWNPLEANGVTEMGKAFELLAAQLSIPPMPTRALPPVIVLLSDGQPTDSYKDGLNKLKALPWFKKAVKIAISIGSDADDDVLEDFTGNKELILQANNAAALAKMIKWASTTASMVSAPASKPMNADAVSTPAGSGNPFAPANGGAPLVIDMSNIPSPDDFDDGAVW